MCIKNGSYKDIVPKWPFLYSSSRTHSNRKIYKVKDVLEKIKEVNQLIGLEQHLISICILSI